MHMPLCNTLHTCQHTVAEGHIVSDSTSGALVVMLLESIVLLVHTCYGACNVMLRKPALLPLS